MTGPTSEGSVNRNFIEENYVENGKIAAVVPKINEKENKLQIETNGQIGIGNDISLNMVSVAEMSKEELEYYIKIRKTNIKQLEGTIEKSKKLDDATKEYMMKKVNEMKREIAVAKKELDRVNKDDISK